MIDLATAWMLGCVCGFFMGAVVAGGRRPTCRELMRERRLAPGRIVDGYGRTTGYIPYPSEYK